MKDYVKSFMAIALFAMTFSLASCGDDDNCYECVGFDDGTTSLEDLGRVCEGDDDGSGGSVTSAQLDEAIELYEALGGTCTKQ